MATLRIKRSRLGGEITLPPSKSHTMRAILLASLAKGESQIRCFLDSPDTLAMIKACRALGANIKNYGNDLFIEGVAGQPLCPTDIIDCGNSGQVLRFITAISALLARPVVLTGDHSLKARRPLAPLLDGLRQLGAECTSLAANDKPPVIITGPIQSGVVRINGQDSQPVSALLVLCCLLAGETRLEVTHAGERPWLELTLSWLRRLGNKIQNEEMNCFKIIGRQVWAGFNYTVPGDLSAMAFPVVAALITRSSLDIHGVDLADCQGDKRVLEYLQAMGASFHYDAGKQCLSVPAKQQLQGAHIDMNSAIDALPIMTVAACYATSTSTFTNVAVARLKESDRLAALEIELGKMGAQINTTSDSITITPSPLTGTLVESHSDHRIAMALVVAAFGSADVTQLEGTACISKSFPGFVPTLQDLGAEVTVA